MTLQEALGKVTDPEVKAFLEKVIGDQNSYVTKLEAQLKEMKDTGSSKGGIDDVTAKYLEKNMRRDVISEATEKIIAAVGQDIFNAVKPDYDKFLADRMTKNNTTVEYAVDAFNLVYGRCFAQKDHPVHNVGKTTNPTGTPTQQPAGTNGQSVAQVQNILTGQPPVVMTGKDTGAASGLPGTQGTPVNSTRDAFKRLKDRVQANGGNRFQ